MRNIFKILLVMSAVYHVTLAWTDSITAFRLDSIKNPRRFKEDELVIVFIQEWNSRTTGRIKYTYSAQSYREFYNDSEEDKHSYFKWYEAYARPDTGVILLELEGGPYGNVRIMEIRFDHSWRTGGIKLDSPEGNALYWSQDGSKLIIINENSKEAILYNLKNPSQTEKVPSSTMDKQSLKKIVEFRLGAGE